MLPLSYFERYRSALAALLTMPKGEHYSRAQLLSDAFRIFTASGLDVFYAPFSSCRFSRSGGPSALVGLTPGFTRMENAFRAAKDGECVGMVTSFDDTERGSANACPPSLYPQTICCKLPDRKNASLRAQIPGVRYLAPLPRDHSHPVPPFRDQSQAAK